MEGQDPITDGTAPRLVRRADYLPPAFLVDRIDLTIRLDPRETIVASRLTVRPNGEGDADLVLDGERLTLRTLVVDGVPLGANGYRVDDDKLTIFGIDRPVTVEAEVAIDPSANTALEGLYLSNGTYCTQCEAEGFRRITYFPDRPDVMARFAVRIEADPATARVLLSNGNLVASGELPGGCHFAEWDDPFPKPSYLFALVAGNLSAVRDRFVTRSGRSVDLAIWVEPSNEPLTGHAMAALKKAMAWDEEVYGFEYDLDVFNIVAIGDFNMGAMENKSLNIFNSKYILADIETATDDDHQAIESVVAHEYFHNWTGNRITCRDWFQLSLKEGLTVFRDQQFSADMGSPAVRRIADVETLRRTQFAEDAGPTAHPIRPDSYIEINNFYTPTVYEKGAEVIRMLHTLAGPERYRRGIETYVDRHDGAAVTCDDFVDAIEAGAGLDLGRFRTWYAQAGTPEVTVRLVHDPVTATACLTITQATPPTAGQPTKQPLVLPCRLGLVGQDGRDVPVTLAGESAPGPSSRVIEITEARQTVDLTGLPERPVPSLFRGFSAPVKLDAGLSRADLAHLFRHDSDAFNRWEAGQTLASETLLQLVDAYRLGRDLSMPGDIIDSYRQVLSDPPPDLAAAAQMLAIPSEAALAQRLSMVDVDAIHAARGFFRRSVSRLLRAELLVVLEQNRATGPVSMAAEAVGRRAWRNLALAYLLAEPDDDLVGHALAQYDGAMTMTDRMAAFAALSSTRGPVGERAWDRVVADFYQRFQGRALVIDKWFAVQARADRPDVVDRVRDLMRHPDFTLRNPNRLRSLIAGFGSNQAHFHRRDGAGYQLLGEVVREVDALNPQVAAMLLTPMRQWRRFDDRRQHGMRRTLEAVIAGGPVSRDVFEVVTRSLAPPPESA